MPVTFTNFLEQISHNLDAHDGPRLAYLLRVTGPHVKDLLREFKNPTVSTATLYTRRNRSDGPRLTFAQQLQGLSRYQGAIESPWDEIAIHYVLIAHHIARRRPSEAFKEHTALIKFVPTLPRAPHGAIPPRTLKLLTDVAISLGYSLFYRFLATTSGWTLPALFAVLRDLKDLAFDVNTPLIG